MKLKRGWCGWMLLALLIAGCSAGVRTAPPIESTPEPVIAPTIAATTPAPSSVRGGTNYTVDPVASQVAILVYRGGALARLGHNHVMTAKSLSGRVVVNPSAELSSFELSFPVAELEVDDTQARRAAGAEFAGEIDQDDRDGTRRNMLKPEVLDAEHFARVSLRSLRVTPPLRSATIRTRVTIRNVSRDIDVPVAIESSPDTVTATGEFPVKQSDFGIKPFSIGLGALEVVDQLQIRFKVVANRR